jgi:hypothetical protein
MRVRKPLPQIAQALGVDAVVEGSVVRSGSKVRISAQLIYAPGDRHLWAESFEGPANDVLSVQDDGARAIVEHIQGKLHSQPRQNTPARKPLHPDAYEAYLRGLYFFDKREAEASDCLSRVDLGLRMAYYPPTERGCGCQGLFG